MALYVSHFDEKSLTYIIVTASSGPSRIVVMFNVFSQHLTLLLVHCNTRGKQEEWEISWWCSTSWFSGELLATSGIFYPIRLWISWSSIISAISEEFGSKQTNRQTFCYFRGGLSSSLFYQNLRYLGKLPLIVQSLKIFKGQYSLWFVW